MDSPILGTNVPDPQYYKNLSPGAKASYEKLQKLSHMEARTKGGFVDSFQRLISSVGELWRKSPFYRLTTDYNLLVMAQDRLSDTGGYNFILKSLFLDQFKGKAGARYHDLREGIKNMRTLEANIVLGVTGLGRNELAKSMFHDFEKLTPGTSMWIDLSSKQGEHAMKGRIACQTDGKYIFQMANTGAGILENPDLHKKEMVMGRPIYQTVIEWGPFDKAHLSKEFFQDIVNATLLGTTPKSSTIDADDQKQGDFGENLKPIQAVYTTVRHHMPDTLLKDIPSKNSRYWNREQQGPSCAANSFWALTRVILNKEEYQNERTDVRLQNLQRNFKKVVSGDETDFTRIRTTDLVNNLIKKQERAGKIVPKVLQEIRSDLVNRDATCQVKLINQQPLTLSNSTKEIPIRDCELHLVPGTLSATVNLSDLVTSDGAPVTLTVKQDNITTLAYILYEAVLSGNHDQVAKALDAFSQKLSKSKLSDFRCDEKERSNLYFIIQLYLRLAGELRGVDGTIQARTEQLGLVNVATTLFTIYFKNGPVNDAVKDLGKLVQSQMAEALEYYRVVGTSFYKGENENIFGQKAKSLRPWAFQLDWVAIQQQIQLTIDPPKQKKFDLKIVPFTTEPTTVTIAPFVYDRGLTQAQNKSIEVKVPHKDLFVAQHTDISAKSLPGKAYLFYYYLATGQESKLKQAVGDVLQLLKPPIDVKEAPALQQVATFLYTYAQDLRKLDTSADSLLLQHTATLLANRLLTALGIKAEKTSKEQVKELLQFYEAITPYSFVKNGELRSLYTGIRT